MEVGCSRGPDHADMEHSHAPPGLMVISAPLQITLAFVSLYRLLGWSSFVGVSIVQGA
jgi:hypothetical protein